MGCPSINYSRTRSTFPRTTTLTSKEGPRLMFCISGPARVDLPGAVVEDEISDRDSPDAGSLSSSPSPPQVISVATRV